MKGAFRRARAFRAPGFLARESRPGPRAHAHPPVRPPAEPGAPTNLPPGGTSPTTTVNVVVSTPPIACFGTIPNPPVIIEGQLITLDGRCSTPTGNLAYEWDLGDERRKTEAFITPTYR